MEEAIGKRVKIFFRNGMTCEGFVSKWANNEAVLRSLESDDVVFLPDVKEDVFMVRFFFQDKEVVEKPPKEGLPPIIEPELEKPKPIKAQAQVPPSQPKKVIDKQELRLKKLVELRAQQKKELEENVSKRLKSHVPTNIQRPTYVQPSFTKPVSKNNTSS